MALEDWDDLRLVLAVAAHKTLTATATVLGVDQSTVTRRLRACEDRCGVKLFDRLRGGIELTPAGKAFVRAASEVEERLFALERELSAETSELSPVRVTLSTPLAALWIDDFVQLARTRPELRLELEVGDAFRDLNRREADVALRRAKNPPEYLVGRRLSEMAEALYGAPGLLELPLDQLPWVGWEPDLEGSALEVARREFSPRQSFTLYANSLLVLLDAARKGHTAIRLACAIGDADPGLVRLTEPVMSDTPLWVLTHPDLRGSPSVKLVMEFITTLVKSNTDALLGRR
ncbi:MAG: LysR family transcriptional regulator [Myxococcota bacterium]